ncbi:MAG: cupin domain-containing protein [Phycisphaerales bacterium JB040]
MPAPTPIDLAATLAQFSDHWNPRLIAELNGQHRKLAKVEGECVWHHHAHEDELFLVIHGTMRMDLQDGDGNERSETLTPGQLIVIPKGTEHRPASVGGECSVLLFEPAGTLNTGTAEPGELTRRTLERLD